MSLFYPNHSRKVKVLLILISKYKVAHENHPDS